MTEQEYLKYQEDNQLTQKGGQVEEYLADSEYSDAETKEEDLTYDQHKYSHDRQICDRSFTDLGYIGYHKGIDLQQLDTTANT